MKKEENMNQASGGEEQVQLFKICLKALSFSAISPSFIVLTILRAIYKWENPI